jgi:hypothetical protein
MANWYWPFSKKQEELSQQPTSQQRMINEEAAAKLMQLSEELESYKSNGATDPMLIAQAKVLAENLRSRGGIMDYQVAAAYGAVYMKVADTRKKLIREVDKMRYFYLVDVIISQFVEDALAPEIGTGDILSVSSGREDLQKEIDLLEEKFDLDQLALSIAPDMIAYGDYTLATTIVPKPGVNKVDGVKLNTEGKNEDLVSVVKATDFPIQTTKSQQQVIPLTSNPAHDDGFGLMEINDIVEQGTVVALTQYSDTTGYISMSKDGKVKKHETADFVKFSLSSQRIRIDLHKEFSVNTRQVPEELKNIPRYIRVGRSIIYPVISKLKELELLEALVPATKLSKLATGTVVGVQVPAGYDIQKAMEASRHVEQILNKRMGVDDRLGELTIENIMNTTGRIKVVPIFGDKGQLSKLDYQSDEPDQLLASVDTIRKVICSSVGIPYEILFGSDSEIKKGEILKKYARYLRKLKSIQKAIEEGMRQLVYIHLVNKGYQFTNEDIKVEFYNKLIEIDNLDKLEFIDTTIGLLDNARKFVMDLADKTQNPLFADKVNVEDFMEFLNNHLKVIGFTNLIHIKQDKVVGDTKVQGQHNVDPNHKGTYNAETPGPKDISVKNLQFKKELSGNA